MKENFKPEDVPTMLRNLSEKRKAAIEKKPFNIKEVPTFTRQGKKRGSPTETSTGEVKPAGGMEPEITGQEESVFKPEEKERIIRGIEEKIRDICNNPDIGLSLEGITSEEKDDEELELTIKFSYRRKDSLEEPEKDTISRVITVSKNNNEFSITRAYNDGRVSLRAKMDNIEVDKVVKEVLRGI